MEAAEIKIIAWMSEASIPQSEIDAILAAEQAVREADDAERLEAERLAEE
tara:strand:- start:717 stop:866 length:150 start_codon:yes stop_codon:yes gene_type:complete